VNKQNAELNFDSDCGMSFEEDYDEQGAEEDNGT
jgi:hypothetical protein